MNEIIFFFNYIRSHAVVLSNVLEAHSENLCVLFGNTWILITQNRELLIYDDKQNRWYSIKTVILDYSSCTQ